MHYLHPVILFRETLSEEKEINIAKNYFDCVFNRTDIGPGQLIIPRYSALPFYKELEYDVNNLGSGLINSYKQHRYVADLMNYVEDLGDLTPKTWMRLEDIDEDGPFILKGETNSKKFLFDSHFFAQTKRDAIDVYCRLMDDGMISDQHIYIRKFIPLKNYLIGLRGLPISDEYRFFILDGKVISGGYYWSNYDEEDLGHKTDPKSVPEDFLNLAISKTCDKIRFYAMDVAQTAEGKWIVIELNDGQQSGLSCNDPDVLYKGLRATIG